MGGMDYAREEREVERKGVLGEVGILPALFQKKILLGQGAGSTAGSTAGRASLQHQH